MKPRLLAGAVAAGALLFAPNVAVAYTCITSSCPAWCEDAPYSLTRASADLGESTTVSEVRRGMDDWTRVSCSSLHTRYDGRSSATAGSGDGRSVIGWVESGWRHDRNAIGVTGPRWGYRGCISEADMEMNGVNYTWTTDSGRYSTVNAYSIILHEGGHYYGLGHSSSRSATMYASYGGGISTLSSDDETGICALYPGGGGGTSGEDPPADCTSTGCPAGEECVGGTCVPESDPGGGGSTGDVCSPCASSADCGGSADWCLGYPDGSGYCGAACSSDADCDGAARCTTVSGVGQCVLYGSGGSPSCDGAGDPPPTSGCSTDADCGSGEICDAGSCVAAPTGDPGAGFGEPCTSNADCESELCAVPSGETTGFCTEVCTGGDCPTDYECVGAGSVDVCAPTSSGSEPPPTAEPTPDAGGSAPAPDGGIAPLDPGGEDPGGETGSEDPGATGDGREPSHLRGGGCSASGSPVGGAWWLGLPLLVLLRRRRNE